MVFSGNESRVLIRMKDEGGECLVKSFFGGLERFSTKCAIELCQSLKPQQTSHPKKIPCLADRVFFIMIAESTAAINIYTLVFCVPGTGAGILNAGSITNCQSIAFPLVKIRAGKVRG